MYRAPRSKVSSWPLQHTPLIHHRSRSESSDRKGILDGACNAMGNHCCSWIGPAEPQQEIQSAERRTYWMHLNTRHTIVCATVLPRAGLTAPGKVKRNCPYNYLVSSVRYMRRESFVGVLINVLPLVGQ